MSEKYQQETLFYLHEILNKHFDLDEIRTLCFLLGVDYDDLPPNGKSGKSRDLVLLLYRQNRLNNLVEKINELRPNSSFSASNFSGQLNILSIQSEHVDISPPNPFELFGRDEEIFEIKHSINQHKTLVIGGPPGVGKSAIATNVCDDWRFGPTIWIDCQIIESVQDVLFLLNAFAKTELSDQMLVHLSSNPNINIGTAGKSVGNFLNKYSALLVWDNYEPSPDLKRFIENIHQQIENGRQIITEREHSSWLIPDLSVVKISPLTTEASIAMFIKYSSQRPSQPLIDVTKGHPYLILLATAQLQTMNIEETTIIIENQGQNWLENSIFDSLSSGEITLLSRCAIFRSGFKTEWVMATKKEIGILSQLASKFLVVKQGKDQYIVHDLIRSNCISKLSDRERQNVHKKAVDLLWEPAIHSISALKELCYHTMEAGEVEKAQEAITSFVNLVAGLGYWGTVIDATSQLDETEPSTGWQEANYLRGRGFRLAHELEKAKEAYKRAQIGNNILILEYARYEEGSVLVHMGEDDSARPIYESLLSSENAQVTAAARMGLVYLIEDTEFETKVKLLKEAKEITVENNLVVVEAQVEHVWGEMLLRKDLPQDALAHLEESFQIRNRLAEDGLQMIMLDLIGWYNLLFTIYRAEKRLDNRENAFSAANLLLELSWKTRDLYKVAETVYEFCSAATPKEYDDAFAACVSLEEQIRNHPSYDFIVEIMGYLIGAYWNIEQFDRALEVSLKFDREDIWKNVPLFFLLGSKRTELLPKYGWHKAFQHPNYSGWVLLIPEDISQDEFYSKFDLLAEKYPGATRMLVSLQAQTDEPTNDEEDQN